MGATELMLLPAVDAKSPLALLPGSLGNFDAYVAAVNRIPMLLPEEEDRLARQYRERGDLDSAGKLVLSHLRLVVSVARNYLGYGLPHADLVQEGNIGLMKAVKRFDPDRGVRLVSFALHWIRAEIHEYVLRNWRLVKVATTKAQRKLFFNLRSMKTHSGSMTQRRDRRHGARAQRAAGGRCRDGDAHGRRRSGAGRPAGRGRRVLRAHRLPGGPRCRAQPGAANAAMPTRCRVAACARPSRPSMRAAGALSRPGGSTRAADGTVGTATLHDLAQEFGVSAERIRQIEAKALRTMRDQLQSGT